MTSQSLFTLFSTYLLPPFLSPPSFSPPPISCPPSLPVWRDCSLYSSLDEKATLLPLTSCQAVNTHLLICIWCRKKRKGGGEGKEKHIVTHSLTSWLPRGHVQSMTENFNFVSLCFPIPPVSPSHQLLLWLHPAQAHSLCSEASSTEGASQSSPLLHSRAQTLLTLTLCVRLQTQRSFLAGYNLRRARRPCQQRMAQGLCDNDFRGCACCQSQFSKKAQVIKKYNNQEFYTQVTIQFRHLLAVRYLIPHSSPPSDHYSVPGECTHSLKDYNQNLSQSCTDVQNRLGISLSSVGSWSLPSVWSSG